MAVRTELQRRVQQTPQLLVKMLMGLVALILIIAARTWRTRRLPGTRPQPRDRHTAVYRSGAELRGAPTDDRESHRGDGEPRRGAVGRLPGDIRLLETLSVPSDPPNVLGVQLDWRVVQFSLLAAPVELIFFGLAPAWQTARADFMRALKTGAGQCARKRRTFRPRRSDGRAKSRLRWWC